MGTLVSIIMSVYQESVDQVKNSIESILSQTYKHWELVVVLDCPNNLLVKKYLTHLSDRHENILIIQNQANIGLGASLNKAVSSANGIFCARMDAEDSSFEDRLEKQMNFILNKPDVDLFFTQWQEIHSNGTVIKREPRSQDVRDIKRNFFIKSLLLHPTLVIRTEVLKKHPYPEIDRPEDWVLFLELIKLGYRFDLLEEILYSYVVDNEKKYQKVRVYSANLLPHLVRNFYHYSTNIYYWLFFSRIIGEFLISRNEYIYLKTSNVASRLWKKIFKSV